MSSTSRGRHGRHATPGSRSPTAPTCCTGTCPVSRRSYVRSEHDEPLTTQERPPLDAGDGTSLCRCGHSGNKPFCDGSHKTADWDNTETAATDSYDDRARTLPGTGVTVRDDKSLCTHAGFCGTKDSSVWKMVKDTEDTEKRSLMMAMVSRCPSGRLTQRLPGEDRDLEPDLRPAVHVADDGAYEVTGRVRVQRNDGQPLETRNRMSLCRCGASGNKPFCDGSHSESGSPTPDGSAQAAQGPGGRRLAGTHRTVQVARPGGGGLGPGQQHRADVGAQGRAQRRPRAGGGGRRRAATGVRLGGPVLPAPPGPPSGPAGRRSGRSPSRIAASRSGRGEPGRGRRSRARRRTRAGSRGSGRRPGGELS